jgi:T-complex protein 1 subunit alpha
MLPVSDLSDDHLMQALTRMSSKIIGKEGDFCRTSAASMPSRVSRPLRWPMKDKYPSAIHILKAHGKSSLDSYLMELALLNATRQRAGCPRIEAPFDVSSRLPCST